MQEGRKDYEGRKGYEGRKERTIMKEGREEDL
jgi:hypothetical protein